METLIKLAPASVATAFASIVLPVPGGPNKSTPLQGWEKTRCSLIQNEKSKDSHFCSENADEEKWYEFTNRRNLYHIYTLINPPLLNNSGR